MPLVVLLRLVFGFFSFAVLCAAGYVLWGWYQGEVVYDANGVAYLVRDNWRLWLGVALFLPSIGGRFVITPLLAKPDKEPYAVAHGEAYTLPSPTGSTLHVEISGPAEAPPIILTHGWGLDSTIWGSTQRALAKRFRVIMWDLPSLGRSRVAPVGSIWKPLLSILST